MEIPQEVIRQCGNCADLKTVGNIGFCRDCADYSHWRPIPPIDHPDKVGTIGEEISKLADTICRATELLIEQLAKIRGE